jgi:hypothetical protein
MKTSNLIATDAKVRQGTTAWFEMVGTLLSEAASRPGLSPDLDVSLVERYTDGVELSKGLFQGIRLDIRGGQLSFRVGVRRDERADTTVEVTATDARELNTLHGAAYDTARNKFLGTGEMQVDGDPSRMGHWLSSMRPKTSPRCLRSRSFSID